MTPYRQKILDLFEDGRWLTNGEIVAATGFHASKVNQDLRWLIDNDKIQFKTDPARASANVYRKSTMPSVGRVKLLDSYLRGCNAN